MSERTQVVCGHCDSVVGLPSDRLKDGPRCPKCHFPLFEGKPVELTAANFDKHVNRSDLPVVVDFWAEWCGPCKAMAPAFEKVAAEFEPEMRFLKVDTGAERSLAAQYNIRSIPTLMIFRRGAIVAQQAGAMDSGSLRNWLRHYL